MKSLTELPLCVRNSNSLFSINNEQQSPNKRLKTECDPAELEQILCEEQDACIEIRDVGSSIARVAKAAITDGSSPSLIQELNAKVVSLQEMIKSIEGIYNKKKEVGCESATHNDLLKDQSRLPLLTRPRRFRKQNKKLTPPSTPVEEATSPTTGKRKACMLCGATHSPEWRKGPAGSKTLCNACGLHYAKVLKQEGSKSSPYSPVAAENYDSSNNKNFFILKNSFATDRAVSPPATVPSFVIAPPPRCTDQFLSYSGGYHHQPAAMAPAAVQHPAFHHHTGQISVTQLLN